MGDGEHPAATRGIGAGKAHVDRCQAPTAICPIVGTVCAHTFEANSACLRRDCARACNHDYENMKSTSHVMFLHTTSKPRIVYFTQWRNPAVAAVVRVPVAN